MMAAYANATKMMRWTWRQDCPNVSTSIRSRTCGYAALPKATPRSTPITTHRTRVFMHSTSLPRIGGSGTRSWSPCPAATSPPLASSCASRGALAQGRASVFGGRMPSLLAPRLAKGLKSMAGMQPGPLAQSMSRKLEALLKPTSLTITNESSLHAGHVGNPTGAPDAETHFRVEAVAEAFAGQSLVQRHRMVYSAVQEELDGGVHALALSTRTPEEEARRNKVGSGQAAK